MKGISMKSFIFLCGVILALVGLYDSAFAQSISVAGIKKITTGGKYSIPQWSPDGTKIYASGPNGEIVVMNADGTNPQALNAGDGLERRFEISPDGKQILFEFKDALWLMNSDGSNQREIVQAKAFQGIWSPDGTKIAYGTGDLWIMNADGSGKTKLIEHAVPESFSLDGKKILFSSFSGDTYGISTINIDGTGQSFIKAGVDFNPVFSPDGNEVFYEDDSLYSFDLQTKNKTKLTGSISSFSLSPDGSMVAYAYRLEEEGTAATTVSDIWAMNSDGTGAVQVTNTPDIYEASPRWSPDGKKIVFSEESSSDLYVATIAVR